MKKNVGQQAINTNATNLNVEQNNFENSKIHVSEEVKKKFIDDLELFRNSTSYTTDDVNNLILRAQALLDKKYYILDIAKKLITDNADKLSIYDINILRTIDTDRIITPYHKAKGYFDGTVRTVYHSRYFLNEVRLDMGTVVKNTDMKILFRKHGRDVPVDTAPAYTINPINDDRENIMDTYYQKIVLDQASLFKWLFIKRSMQDIDSLISTVHELSACFIKHVIGIATERPLSENFTNSIPDAVYIGKYPVNRGKVYPCKSPCIRREAYSTPEKSVQDIGVEVLQRNMHNRLYACFNLDPLPEQYWISDTYSAPEGIMTLPLKAESIDSIVLTK